MRARRMVVIAALLAASAARAADIIEVIFNSDPQGATLFEGERPVGTMPYTAKYAVEPADRTRGFKRIIPLEARWASGARAPLAGNSELPTDKGAALRATFTRPTGAPGLDIDLKLAERLGRADAATTGMTNPGRQAGDEEARRNREAAAGAVGDFMDGWTAGRRNQSPTPPLPQPPLELRCRGTGPNQVDCTQR